MTAPTRRRRPAPAQATIDKAGRLATDPDRPILVDVDDPDGPAFAALVPSDSNPHAAYHVTYGPRLGWRCTHPYAWGVCAHMMACWVLLAAGPDAAVWAERVEAWMNRTEEEE